MSAEHNVEDLKNLLKSVEKSVAPADPGPVDDPLEQFVYSFLLWESTRSKADQAMKRIAGAVVDFNELRVCLQPELESILGERYPLVSERARRIKLGLHSVYLREHAVSLDHLSAANKRDAKKYLDTLEHVPSFVAARVLLLSLGGHAMPLDQQLFDKLVEEEIFDEGMEIERASSILERHVKAAEGVETYLLLEGWSESAGGAGGRKRRSRSSRAKKSSDDSGRKKKPARSQSD